MLGIDKRPPYIGECSNHSSFGLRDTQTDARDNCNITKIVFAIQSVFNSSSSNKEQKMHLRYLLHAHR